MKKAISIGIVLLGLVIWIFPSDIVKLIVEHKPVLFGRYSQGHFASLILLTAMLWTFAGMLLASQKFDLKLFGNLLLVLVSSSVSLIFVIWVSKLVVSPRYIEENVTHITGGASIALQGIVRHRPPNQKYEYVQVDEPPQLRSYPSPPKGHADVSITLTSDAQGYRNTKVYDQSDILVIGDSFAAGSRVSDAEAWPSILSDVSKTTLYNLGTSGTDIQDYLATLVVKGLTYRPKIVILMVYEGNDFKKLPVILDSDFQEDDVEFLDYLKDSPVSAALKRLSRNIFEHAYASDDVPEYTASFPWMPIEVKGDNDSLHYYSFRPVRPLYLNVTKADFEASEIWQSNRLLLDRFVQLAQEHHFTPVIAYAPSKPHIVMPLTKERIPAEQLYQFLSYKKKNLPEPVKLKQALFANFSSIESVVSAYCEANNIAFVSTTSALKESTQQGVQTYYTYDQHWTPEGNAIVSEVIYEHLLSSKLL